jgi:hypothetical protein
MCQRSGTVRGKADPEHARKFCRIRRARACCLKTISGRCRETLSFLPVCRRLANPVGRETGWRQQCEAPARSDGKRIAKGIVFVGRRAAMRGASSARGMVRTNSVLGAGGLR